MLTHAEGYEDITYHPRGRSWFVLSGRRGDQIYYEKVIFSCSGHVVNVLGVTTIMNAKLEALTYAVNCTIRRRY
jgi:hypothetical protein